MRLSLRFARAGSVLIASFGVLLLVMYAYAASDDDGDTRSGKYAGVLGADSEKIKHEGGKTLLWAGPLSAKPGSPDAQWYDFTGSSIPAAELQFGIGKDSIRAIDDPLFVSPDDSRLLDLPRSHYRREKKPQSTNEIRVIGYASGSRARAYPVSLLDGHELVNDEFEGKPVTVGW